HTRARHSVVKAELSASRNITLMAIWGTETDIVATPAARTRGIYVTHTPAVSAIAVAEHTLSLIMAVAKQTILVDRQVKEGKWPRAMVTQLYGKTMGLIGTGAIGREVARLARGIGMHVIAWTYHPKQDLAEWVSFEDVFQRSDVVSVHVRQSPETIGMIRRKHFDLMKPSAIFINTARGPIVREADL